MFGKVTKRLLAFLLAFVMVWSMLPVGVLAEVISDYADHIHASESKNETPKTENVIQVGNPAWDMLVDMNAVLVRHFGSATLTQAALAERLSAMTDGEKDALAKDISSMEAQIKALTAQEQSALLQTASAATFNFLAEQLNVDSLAQQIPEVSAPKIPLPAQSAAMVMPTLWALNGTVDSNELVDGLEYTVGDLTYGTFSKASDGFTITAKKNSSSKASTTTVTLKNNTESKYRISFKCTYSAPSAGIGGNTNQYQVAGKSYTTNIDSISFELTAGATLVVNVSSGSGVYFSDGDNKSTASLAVSALKFEEIVESDVTLNFDSAAGSVTVGNETVTNGQTVVFGEDGATVSVTANSGYTFHGWRDQNGNIYANGQTLTFSQDTTLTAVFTDNSKTSGVFMVGTKTAQTYKKFVGDVSLGDLGVVATEFEYYTVSSSGAYYFDDLNDAAVAAAAISGVVVLTQDYTLPAGDYYIPSGATLLIPFDETYTLYTTGAHSAGEQVSATHTVNEYRTLTMANGANLIVNGAMSLSNKHYYAAGSKYSGGAPAGDVSFVRMQGSSSITVNGALYAYGFITGSGSVTANSGSTVYEMFQIMDFRGGNQSTDMQNGVFPLSQYYVQNIEVPMTLHYGATEYAYTTIYMSSTDFGSAVGFISTTGSGAMFQMAEGSYVKKWYDGAEDRLKIEAFGSLSLSPIVMNVGTSSLDSAEYVLPINCNISLTVLNGSTVTISQDVALLPGAQIEVETGATCTLASGVSVYIYDADQWGGYCGPSDKTIIPVGYAPGKTGSRTTVSDAQVVVNGTMNASAGKVYTTEGGAYITSDGGGKVIVSPGTANGTTYQFSQVTTTYKEIAIVGAYLTNADGTFAKTGQTLGSNVTFTYTNGKWTCNTHTSVSEADCVTTGDCLACGTVVNAAKGHTEVTIAAVAATCTGTGLTEGKKCSVCGVTTVAQTTVAAKGHSYDAGVVTTQPTCTAEGVKTYTCQNDSSHTKTEAVAATGHSYDSGVVTTQPTCTAEGVKTFTCSSCGGTYTETVAAKGHSYTSEVTTAPTCVNQGIKTYTCQNDSSHTYTEAIAATGHTAAAAVQENVVSATCTTPAGYDSVVYCSVCSAERSREFVKTAEPTGHSWDYTFTWTGTGETTACTVTRTCKNDSNHAENATSVEISSATTKEASCKEAGTLTYTATAAFSDATEQGTKPVEIPKTTDHSYGSVVTAPTCTTAGYTTYTCSVCGDSYTADTVAATGHSYGAWTQTVAPECTKDGTERRECENCDAYETQIVTATGHSYDSVVTPPTCTTAGYTTYTCSVCDDSYTDDTVAATGHSWKAATCTVSKTCTVCSATEGDPLGHTEVVDEAVAATCTGTGLTEGSHCSVCKETIVAQTVVDALGHNFTKEAVGALYQQSAANCEKAAVYYKSCDRCALSSEGQTGEATFSYGEVRAHNWSDPSYAWTGEGELTAYSASKTCTYTDCGKTVEENAKVTSQITQSATCTNPGTIVYTATFGTENGFTGTTKNVTIPVLPHTLEATAAVANSCTEAGNTAYWTCSACGKFFSDANGEHEIEKDAWVLAAKGHDYVDHEAKAETCEEIGWHAYQTCSRCDYTSYVEIPAKDHNYDTTKSEANLTRPVLVDGVWVDGYYTYTCKNDSSHTKTEKVVRATYTAYEQALADLQGILALDLTDGAKAAVNQAIEDNKLADNLIASEQGTVDTATANLVAAYNTYKDALNTYTVTFVVDGVQTEVTVISGSAATAPTNPTKAYDDTYHYTFSKWDRDFSSVTADLTVTAEFTATAHNYTVHTDKDDTYHTDECACGYTVDVGHNYDAGVQTTAPTCEGTGVKTYTCSVCNGTKEETVDATGHNYDTTKSENNLTRPALENGVWVEGHYTYICQNDASHITTETVARATYTAYEQALANLNALLATDITDEAKEAIRTAIENNTIAQNLIASEQETVDTAEANLKAVFEQYKGALNTYTVTFVVNGVETKVNVISGSTATAPANPTKAYDDTYHYTFSKWDKDFSSVTTDLTVTAEFTATAHNYTVHTDKDDTYHTDECACGYTVDVGHNYDAGVQTTAPTCTEKGVKTYTCSVCNGTKTEEIEALNHDYSVFVKNVDYTCTEQGYTIYRCSRCDATENRDFTPAAHRWEKEYTVDQKASCFAAGSKSYHCASCDAINTESEVVIAKREHSLVDTTVKTAATCKATGVMNQKCNHVANDEYEACTYTTTREIAIDPDAHQWETEYTVDVEASCEENGSKSYHCVYCDVENETSKVVIEKLNHDWHDPVYSPAADYSTWTATKTCKNDSTHVVTETVQTNAVTTLATCYADGQTIYTAIFTLDAAFEQQSYTKVLPKLSHSYSASETAPTCSAQGYTTYTCTNPLGDGTCGHSYKDNYTDALGHNYTVLVETIAPTCTTQGYDVYQCSRCDSTNKQNYTPSAHTPETVYTVIQKASCSADGYKAILCSVCREELQTQTIAKRSHTIVDVDVAQAATCKATGVMNQKCSNAETDDYAACTHTTTRVIPIDPNAHKWETEYTVDMKASCDAAGSKSYHCVYCDAINTGSVVEIAKREHSLVDTTVKTAATCKATGVMNQKCTHIGTDEYEACTYTTTRTIAVDPEKHVGQANVIKNASENTCTQDGYTGDTYWSCCDALAQKGEKISAPGHTEVIDAAVAPTCTATGLAEGKHCSVCGEVLTAQTVVDALGHTEVIDAAVAPTCTATGLIEGSHCSVCNEILVAQTVVDALGHTEVIDAAVAPTCTVTGLAEGKHCDVCGEVLVAQKTVSALGHTPGAAATCTADQVCTVCGEIQVAKLGHDYGAVVTAPTCTAGGYTTYTCTRCSDSYTADETAVLGHNYVGVVTAPTCLTGGYTTYTCSRCSDSYKGDEVQATGHSYVAKVTAPTCLVDGYTTHTCSNCGDSYTDTPTPATGHNYVAVVTAPTCTKAGITTHTCSGCGDSYKTDSVPATGHTVVQDEEIPPLCDEDGVTEGSHCEKCGTVIVAQEVIPMRGHDVQQYAAKKATYTGVGWEAYESCTRCGYTTYVEIPMLDAPVISDYQVFIENLALLEDLAATYAKEVPGTDAANLVIKYIRTGVDRYNSGSWGIMAGYEDKEFAQFVAKVEDEYNSLDTTVEMMTVSGLKNLANIELPNGDVTDIGHMFGTMDITYHNSYSVNHADVAGWAGDIVDLLSLTDQFGVTGTVEEMVAEITESYILKNTFPEDPIEGTFSLTDMYGDLDGLYVMNTLEGMDYENGVLTAILTAYFTEDLSDEQRAAYFIEHRMDGISLRSNLRDAVYNAVVGNKVVSTLEGTREFNSTDLTDLRKACCYAFADYICRLAGDYVEQPEKSYLTVFSSETSVLAPGITQDIRLATSADGKQMAYYIATADLRRDDVHIFANYKDNDPSQGWGMQRVLDQAMAAQNKYGDPESEYYIENYNVIAAINGAGYNMSTGEPSGLLVMNGVEYHSINSSGFFAILKDGTALIGTQADYATYKSQVAEGIAGFGSMLIKNGEICITGTSDYYNNRASRTAVGITATGKVVFMVLDGRQEPFSCGGSMEEIAQIMFEAGCVEAINLDGGGSTTFVSKQEGAESLEVINSPSDGYARSVSTSLIMVSTAPSSTAFDHAVIEAESNYLTVGTSLQMTASGVSATGNATELPEGVTWAVSDEAIATITQDGILTAVSDGTVEVYLMLGEEVVGNETMYVVIPDNVFFDRDTLTAVYGQAVELPVKFSYEGKLVAGNISDVEFSLSNTNAGTITGFTFVGDEASGIKSLTITVSLVKNEAASDTIAVSLYNQGEASFDFNQATGGDREMAWDREVSNSTTVNGLTYEVIDPTQDMVTSYIFAIDMSQIQMPEKLADLTYMLPGADVEGASAWTFLCQLAERISDQTEVKAVVNIDPNFDVDISDLTLVNEYFILHSTDVDEETNQVVVTLRWKKQTEPIPLETANPICILSGIKLTPKDDAAWDASGKLSVVNSGEVSYTVYMRASGLYSFSSKPENQAAYDLYPYIHPENASEKGGYFSSVYKTFEDSYTLINVIKSGWVIEEGGFAYYVDGQRLTGIQLIDGYYYAFDENGINVGQTKYTGLLVDEVTGNYMYSQFGLISTGWNMINNKWHYFYPDTGFAAVGEQVIYVSDLANQTQINENITYVFTETGMLTAEVWHECTDGNTRLYFGPGFYKRAWKEIDGEMYFLTWTGVVAKGVQPVRNSPNDPEYYYVFHQETGALISICDGFVTHSDGKTYYYPTYGSGAMLYGLNEIDGKYYYFSGSGVMYTGWQTVPAYVSNGLLSAPMDIHFHEEYGYAIDAEGNPLTSLDQGDSYPKFVTVGGKTYYYLSAETVAYGFYKIGDYYYYFSTSSGEMRTGVYTVQAYASNGILSAAHTYTFDATHGYAVDENGNPLTVPHVGTTTVVTAPTCTTAGEAKVDCAYCTYAETITVDALGHDLTQYEGQAATCTEAGWNAYEACSRCDYTTYDAIDALGHMLTSYEGKDATCTEAGWKAYETCSECDHTTYEAVEALGHNLTQYEAKAPTCTEIGWDAYETCSRCDYSTYEELSATGHSYGTEWTTDDNAHWHECAGCGDRQDQEDHSYDTETGNCTVCGRADVLIGDVNRDGRVNNLDRMILSRYLAKWPDYPAESLDLVAADVNCDGRVNNLDRMILSRYLAKWPEYSELPYLES